MQETDKTAVTMKGSQALGGSKHVSEKKIEGKDPDLEYSRCFISCTQSP
jgi:hypothetical protein